MPLSIECYATAPYTEGFNVTLFGQTLHRRDANNFLVALAISLALVAAWALLLSRLRRL